MIKRAFQKTCVMIDLDGYDKNLIRVPRFATYKPPEKNEPYREEPYSKEEIEAFYDEEKKYQQNEKKRKREEKRAAQIARNKQRAKRIKT